MNLAEIREEIRERVGEVVAYEDFFLTTQIDRLVNRAQVRFCHEEMWPWLISLQEDIPVPANTDTIELIDDVVASRHWSLILAKSNGDILLPKRVALGEAPEVRRQTRSSTGDPRWYVVAKTVRNTYVDENEATAHTIKLYPTPNVALTAEYYYIREPTPMALDGDEPDMPDAYHDAIVSWVTAKLWEKELVGGGSKRQEQLEEYNHVLSQARHDMKQQANDDSLIVGNEQPRADLEPFISYHNIPETLGP